LDGWRIPKEGLPKDRGMILALAAIVSPTDPVAVSAITERADAEARDAHGARGAITLAGVMTMPLLLADGTPFPARGLAIFLAAGVIILSLVAANVALPRLRRRPRRAERRCCGAR
jgi:NhaP-type Na+/H+ or K+/H+ antiporter